MTGMPTKQYREVQINLRPKEAAREASTHSMLGMTGTSSALVRDNLTDGSSANEQLEFMQDKCSQAAKLLGLHKKARQVQPREYIAGNKRLMSGSTEACKNSSCTSGSLQHKAFQIIKDLLFVLHLFCQRR